MSRKKRLLRLSNAVYLNANIIYGETLKTLQANKKKSKGIIRTGDIKKLLDHGYSLVTSDLTKMEVVQNLIKEQNVNPKIARECYFEVCRKFNIVQISNVNDLIPLNSALLDILSTSHLDFKDGLHLEVARKIKAPVCTHDKKMYKKASKHLDKQKYYAEVYKPYELLERKIN